MKNVALIGQHLIMVYEVGDALYFCIKDAGGNTIAQTIDNFQSAVVISCKKQNILKMQSKEPVKVGDKVTVLKGNMPELTVSYILDQVVYFEESNDTCFISEIFKSK